MIIPPSDSILLNPRNISLYMKCNNHEAICKFYGYIKLIRQQIAIGTKYSANLGQNKVAMERKMAM
jgi:hypothetical protein